MYCRRNTFLLVAVATLLLYLLIPAQKSSPIGAEHNWKQPKLQHISDNGTRTEREVVSQFKNVLNLLEKLPKSVLRAPLNRSQFLMEGPEYWNLNKNWHLWVDLFFKHRKLYTPEDLNKFR